MKVNKCIAIWSGIIAVIALILSLLTYFYFYCEYETNVLIGIFSSGILVCVTSIISYFHERNRILYLLYDGCFNFLKQFEKNIRRDNQIDVHVLASNYNDIIASYKKDIYYHVNELATLSKRSKIRKNIMNIWENSRKMYLLVLDDYEVIQSFALNEISHEELNSIPCKHNSPEGIAYIKKLGEELNELAYQMNYYNLKKEKSTEVNNNAD